MNINLCLYRDIHRMRDLKFIHITKCAGTFIEEIGRKHNIEWGRFHKEYRPYHKNFKEINSVIKKKYDWFVIVRNPYERLLSEYYCMWGGIGKKPEIKHTKQEFNDYLIKSIKSKSGLSPGGHYTPQFKYIDKDVKLHIIKYENLLIELNDLLNNQYKLGINMNTHVWKNKRKYNINRYNVNDFNDELITLVNSVYDQDFKLLGYEKKLIESD